MNQFSSLSEQEYPSSLRSGTAPALSKTPKNARPTHTFALRPARGKTTNERGRTEGNKEKDADDLLDLLILFAVSAVALFLFLFFFF